LNKHALNLQLQELFTNVFFSSVFYIFSCLGAPLLSLQSKPYISLAPPEDLPGVLREKFCLQNYV
jgi:hypothetical protein